MEKTQPSVKELREFGLLFGGLLILFFGLLIPWLWGLEISPAKWPWPVGGLFVLWALLLPATLKPVFVVWMRFGHMMGWINTRIIMSLLFFGVFLPIGMLLRLLGKDPMARRFEAERHSYRIATAKPDVDQMERPY